MSLTHRAKTIVDVGSSVLVTAAALALLWTLLVRNPVHPAADPASPARSRVSTVEGLTLDLATASKRIGESSVVLIEFSDFQCPFCARHSRETFPSIRRELVDKGKLTYISFAFPLEGLHPQARQASEAGECAARQGRYWEMHERLFAEPSALSPADFLKNAQALSLNVSAFEACLFRDAATAVAAEIQQGARLGVKSTPTFFVGKLRDGKVELSKRISGAVPYEIFAETIAEVSGS